MENWDNKYIIKDMRRHVYYAFSGGNGHCEHRVGFNVGMEIMRKYEIAMAFAAAEQKHFAREAAQQLYDYGKQCEECEVEK